jgi:catechol 2,3-dioxygenase-like lactoylglutathione lyase family enzyme
MNTPLPSTVAGVDHVAYATFKPAETVHFYRDVLGFPLVATITAKAWGHPDQPDFVHFFFDVGAGAHIAFFYYFGVEPHEDLVAPKLLARARHLALSVETVEDLDMYQQRLEQAGIPLLYRTLHETIESIYVIDPNGYYFEITRRLRPVLQIDIEDAALTMDALTQAIADGEPTLAAVWARKAALIEQESLVPAEVE